MKYTLLFLLVLFAKNSNSQSIGGYDLADYLISVFDANACFEENYVTNFPNDSIWVNLEKGDKIFGKFGSAWSNDLGPDLILETGFHADHYNIRLQLATGLFTDVISISEMDWVELVASDWDIITSVCIGGLELDKGHYILPLDFVDDFSLTPSDEVVAIEIEFLETTGAPDFAGAYITSASCKETSSQTSIESCVPFESPSGNYVWDESGSYIDTLVNAEGCDSILYFGILISEDIDASITLTGGATLTANLSDATYQWLKCPELSPILGATEQSYTAIEVGSYAVIVSNEGCIDTSECKMIDQVSSGLDLIHATEFSIYPNPSSGSFIVDLGNYSATLNLEILNLQGAIIRSQDFIGGQVEINFEAPNGLYFIRIKTMDGYLTGRLLLQE